MFFVLSTGRSGTLSIARTLRLLNNCVCSHEPPPELILESSAYRYGEFPKNKLRDILLKTRKPTVNGSVYCESNQVLSLIIPVLAEVFPAARYIWLIRNGLDMVSSAYQKGWYSGRSEGHDCYEDCCRLGKAWVKGRIQGDRCGDMSPAEWANLDRFGRCCWYWKYVNQVIENDLKKYAPDKYFLLRLEDVGEKLPHLITWMGLKSSVIPPVKRNNPAKGIPYNWTDWSEEKRSTFEHWCGDLMDRFYPSWREYTGKDSELFVAPYVRTLKGKLEQTHKQVEQQREQIVYLLNENNKLKQKLKNIKLGGNELLKEKC